MTDSKEWLSSCDVDGSFGRELRLSERCQTWNIPPFFLIFPLLPKGDIDPDEVRDHKEEEEEMGRAQEDSD